MALVKKKMKHPSPHLKGAVILHLIIYVLINPSSTDVWNQVWLQLELVLQDDENAKSKSITDDDNLIRNAH